MSEHDWTEVVGAIGVFVLITTVITTIIVQVARTWRAKAILAREGEYKKLAETAVQTQEDTARQLAELGTRLAQMEARMTSLERVLKDVE